MLWMHREHQTHTQVLWIWFSVKMQGGAGMRKWHLNLFTCPQLFYFFTIKFGKVPRSAVVNLSWSNFPSDSSWHCCTYLHHCAWDNRISPREQESVCVCVGTCHSCLSDADVSWSGMTLAGYEGGMTQSPDWIGLCCLCVWMRVFVCGLADMRWRDAMPLGRSHTRTQTATSSVGEHEWSFSTSQQYENKSRGGKGGGWRMGSHAKRNMVGSSVLLPVSWWAPQANILWMRAYLWELHFNFTLHRRKRRRWRRGDSSMMSYKWKMLKESRCAIEDVNFGLLIHLVVIFLSNYYLQYCWKTSKGPYNAQVHAKR